MKGCRGLAFALSIALGVAGFGFEPRARASGPEAAAEDLDAAMAHFKQGIALYEEGDYSAALFEFERAYEVKPDYRLLYNIGATALELKDYAAAQGALARYLEGGGDEIEASRRAEVQAQLKRLEGRVGTVRVDCNVRGALIRVDGSEVGTTPLPEPLVLNLGLHTVEATAAGSYQPFSTEVQVAGGSTSTLEIEFESTVAPEVAPPPRDVSSDVRPSRASKLRIATFVGVGVTAAAGVGLAVAGSLALRAEDDLQSELARFPAEEPRLDDARDRRGRLATTSDAMIGVTAVFAAVTIGLGIATVVAKRRANNTTARVQPGRRGVSIRF